MVNNLMLVFKPKKINETHKTRLAFVINKMQDIKLGVMRF